MHLWFHTILQLDDPLPCHPPIRTTLQRSPLWTKRLQDPSVPALPMWLSATLMVLRLRRRHRCWRASNSYTNQPSKTQRNFQLRIQNVVSLKIVNFFIYYKNQNPRLKTSLFSRSNLTLPPVKWRTMFRLILIVYNRKFILYDNVIYNSFKNLFCLLKKRIHNNADA